MGTGKPSPLRRLGYFMLGIRPKAHMDWVEQVVAAPRWHLWVPRLRVTIPSLIAVWIFAGPWNEEVPDWSGFFLTSVVALMWLLPVGDGVAERKRELLYQNHGGDWFRMMFAPFMKVAEAVSPPDSPPSSDAEPTEHPAVPVATEGMVSTCSVCGGQVQRDDERWIHKDPHWFLYECPRCGWQDAVDEPCPNCGAPSLTRYETPSERDHPALRVAYLVSLGTILVALAYWIISDEQVRAQLNRLF